MSKSLMFVLVWSCLCFVATLAVAQLDLESLAAVLCEAWLVNVGVDMCLEDG